MSEPSFWRHKLTPSDLAAIETLVKPVLARCSSPEDVEFLREARLIAQEMPRSVRQTLYQFTLLEPPCGVCMVSGLPVDDQQIGPTPEHWIQRNEHRPTLFHEVLLLLLGSLLGEVMGWATQQGGHLIHQVFPIRIHENEQLGTGSRQLLWWHNEDAFHQLRPDYLCLMCLRNPERVPTMIASLENLALPDQYLDQLFEPQFTIRPDESHQKKNMGDQSRGKVSYEHIEALNRCPEKIPVLYGHRSSPYLRLDPYFMDPVEDNPKAQLALNSLIRLLDSQIRDIVLEPGDCCILDNYRAVHGRRAFQARYDGRDRWLQRINITRDLRKSRHCRSTSDSRVLS